MTIVITVYTKPACVQWNATRRALDMIAENKYQVVDVSEDADARDFVMSLGHLQPPTVVLTDEHGKLVWLDDGTHKGVSHWSGHKPDRLKLLAERLVS